jgi:hypothetical protein
MYITELGGILATQQLLLPVKILKKISNFTRLPKEIEQLPKQQT